MNTQRSPKEIIQLALPYYMKEAMDLHAFERSRGKPHMCVVLFNLYYSGIINRGEYENTKDAIDARIFYRRKLRLYLEFMEQPSDYAHRLQWYKDWIKEPDQ